MILLQPDQDYTITTEHIISTIDRNVDEIALVLLPGIQYYTGQLLDIPRITAHAHSKGLLIGWDLAHGAGNVPLQLHDWDVDFAAWCTYKYMNAGPGSIAGMFVNERHGKVEYADGDGGAPIFRHRLTGWYGGDKASRFNMDNSEFLFLLMPKSYSVADR
jgi:kynureninase